jgi:predicted Fe-Mo cluster-binding NifX family protein
MKVAISATRDAWSAPIDNRFGRAKGFFVVDTETEKTSYVDNRANAEQGHGAGTGAAQSIADAGVQLVITAEVGPNAGSVLKAAGIKVLRGNEAASIADAYDRYRAGSLQEQTL